MTTRQQEHDRSIADSIESFKDHGIVKRSEGRWLLMKRRADGTLDGIMATEVVCLEGGKLYVGGDTFPVIFAYCTDPPIERVRWLGSHNDLRYVAEKASIGFGSQELVRTYDPDIAIHDLNELAKEFAERDDCPPDHPMLVGLRELHARAHDGHAELFGALRELGSDTDCYGFVEDRYYLGMTVSTRVYCAWAALRRLWELLKAEV
jgi:hypothetical protein